MDTFTAIIMVSLSVIMIRKSLGLIWLWWRKEYRWDRMIVHLRTKQGKSLLVGKSDAVFLLILASWVFPSIRDYSSFALLGYSGILAGIYIVRRKVWFLPPSSPKVIVLFAMMVSAALIPSYFIQPPYIPTVVISVLLFPISGVFVMLLGLPTKIYHSYVISAATGMLRAHPKMTVVGVTGSYGKTSVKEYLSTMVAVEYRTLRTELSKNSPIGIAEVVRSSLLPDHQVFVVEMGAYKPDEISYMSQMVRPEIAIITAINPQHQDLFGSIEATVRAKYELIEGLTGRKIAIVNADNIYTRDMGIAAGKQGCDVYWWTAREPDEFIRKQPGNHVYRAVNIRAGKTGISFECVVDSEKFPVDVKVVGLHQAGNVLAAIIAAHKCGMTLGHAVKAASLIRPAQKVMQVIRGPSGTVFVDDTFNNNPDAAIAAMRFMQAHHGKKYMVFQPMIELGSYAEDAHRQVGTVAGEICDAIILTNGNHFDSFREGVRSVSKNVPLSVMSAQKSADYLRSIMKSGDMVLFKGKDAEHTLKLVKS